MFNSQPNNPALAKLTAATVRVGDATGVLVEHNGHQLVIGSDHAVTGLDVVDILGAFGGYSANVYHHHPDIDVGTMAWSDKMPAGSALTIDTDLTISVGDDVWIAGYPSGWKGTTPVLSKANIAAVDGNEVWINGDGTWGNSGGPLVRIADGRPTLIGLVQGRAGSVQDALNDMYQELVKQNNTVDMLGLSMQAKALSLEPDMARLSGAIVAGMQVTLQISKSLVEKIDLHFRTGYLRIVPVEKFAHLL